MIWVLLVLILGVMESFAGFIGNTGLPATTTGHVPFYIAGLAADHQGRVYTVHTWDEPHQDIMTWDAATGQKLTNTGQVIPEALLNSIAVEPDGSVAYVTGWTQEAPALVFRLYKVGLGATPAVINFTVTGRSVELASGQPSSKFRLKITRRYVEVGDPNRGVVTCYDKTSGAAVKVWTGTLPDDTQVTSAGFTVSREYIANGAGSRLIGQGWEQRCTEFAGCISYSQANPNTFISMSRNRYDRSGAWLGCGVSDITKEPQTTGPCKTVTLGGNDFLFFPYAGQYLNIYRIGGTMSVVATVTPSDLALQSFGVSPDGTLWLAVIYRYSTNEFASIWKLPLHGFDASWNPVYDWSDAVEIVPQTALQTYFGPTADPRSIQVMMVNYNQADSLVYALIYLYGQAPDRGGYWMAGNILAAFTPQGTLAWKASLPKPGIGLAVVPTGGVLVGQNFDDNAVVAGGFIHRYNASGSLVQTISPPPGDQWPIGLPSGAFDGYGAINCELAPDGLLDIFAEDDFNARIIWYRTP